ncbi:MAG TPA: hypothetical protein VG755_18200 [Nannocystaceae bacterium]|nr:hypothetical protein [Nannocystaceae bacterium]
MSRDDDALADDARDLLAAYRADEGLPADVRARVWSRVDRSVHAQPEAVAVPPSRARWAVLGLAVAAAIAALWWGRARLDESSRDASPSAASFDRDDARTHEVDTTTTTRETTTPAIPPTLAPAIPPTPAPTRASTPANPPADAPARPAARTPSRASTEVDALADEMELVRAAQSALSRNDAAHALALLDAGKRRFGTGTLAEEREAMHVLALCGAGKRSKARSEADAFAAAHPRSPLLSRVRAACSDAAP